MHEQNMFQKTLLRSSVQNWLSVRCLFSRSSFLRSVHKLRMRNAQEAVALSMALKKKKTGFFRIPPSLVYNANSYNS